MFGFRTLCGRLFAAGMVCVLTSTGAMAQGFCETLANADQGATLPQYSEAEAGCRSSLNMEGKRSLHCMWQFDYRAAEAEVAFNALLDQMRTCAPEAGTEDQGVNHPDFYDLRLFRVEGREVGVSLKDKGALQQTLVFLTVSQN